jgi:hypothetical protein
MNDKQATANPADLAIKTLKSKGKLRVKGDEVFWILCESFNGGFPYGYACSDDGERPAKKYKPFDKYRMMSDSEVYNWIAHLEILES